MTKQSIQAMSVRLQIMTLLAVFPDGLNGYEIGRRLDLSNGSLYPTLAGTVGAAEVRTVDETDPSNGKSKKVYLLTELGREVLQNAMSPRPRSGALVRVATRRTVRSTSPAGPLPQPS